MTKPKAAPMGKQTPPKTLAGMDRAALRAAAALQSAAAGDGALAAAAELVRAATAAHAADIARHARAFVTEVEQADAPSEAAQKMAALLARWLAGANPADVWVRSMGRPPTRMQPLRLAVQVAAHLKPGRHRNGKPRPALSLPAAVEAVALRFGSTPDEVRAAYDAHGAEARRLHADAVERSNRG